MDAASARFLINRRTFLKKKLIAVIIALLLLIAAAVGVIVYMESNGGETTGSESGVTDSKDNEATEETVGLSLPTENSDEVAPDVTFGGENIVPPVTSNTDTGETEDPDANETPEDEF